jgi:acyl-coenzyme A synthetase/AMP-(fatty) acid ligase
MCILLECCFLTFCLPVKLAPSTCALSPYPGAMCARRNKVQERAYMYVFHAADGYYWITGRVDDVINVSGHRIGTAEVESALVLNEKCAEAAVVGFEHPIKGQGIYAFVTLMDGVEFNSDVQRELVQCVPFKVAMR